ncbi:hypothetical protein [Facilibium subflavum]|uniref:hypothetical protein n=1 Tax=Facilibium subflavum TaxID=2219058 RepID=UPI000E64854E|nr:hypothetical protein [Facilibium subflavum]
MFRKIILVVLLIFILFVGYRIIRPVEHTKVVQKKVQDAETIVYVYTMDVKRGEYLVPEMVKPKTMQRQGDQGTIAKPRVDIPYQQNPVMKVSKMQGEVVKREDFLLPGDSEYVRLLHGEEYSVYTFEIHQKNLTDYIGQGDHVDIYALTSVNKSADDFEGKKAKLNPVKDKLGLELLMSNVIVSAIQSREDNIFNVSVLVPSQALGKLIVADKLANIQVTPHLKKPRNNSINIINAIGFNNVKEYRGKGEEN